MNQDFKHIIKGCVAGKADCQRVFFNEFNSKLFAICLRYMQQRNDAEEVLQESWIQIFNGLKNYKEQDQIFAWMKTIAIRTAWKAIRKKQDMIDISTVHYLSDNNLDNQVLEKMTCEEIIGLLRFLPTGCQEVFKLKIIEGYSHKEIANLLNIQESTSRAHLTYARKLMKEKLVSLKLTSNNGAKAI